VQVAGDTMSGNLAIGSNWWSLILRDGSQVDNSAPQSGAGSAYVNDVYIRSIGKWASQLSNATISNPILNLISCRSSFVSVQQTACDFQICVSGVCGPANPNGRQIIMQNPGY